MRAVVIGGTGHIGSYLVPRLRLAGADTVCVSRGVRRPYVEHAAWRGVTEVVLDREAEEAAGTFGQRIAALEADIVVDLTCYTPESAVQLADALRGRVEHLLHCGTIWIHGHSAEVPTTETAPRQPFGEYGIRKAAIEAYYLREARHSDPKTGALPVTLLHPGHIVGTGWNPLNPQGNFNPAVFKTLLRGDELTLPNLGMETVHHVHADDVARGFVCAMEHRGASVGESFHIVSPAALTLRGYAEATARLLGAEAKLRFLPYDAWADTVSEQDAKATWDHIAHSPNCSIAKAQQRLRYQPRYRSMEAVADALLAMRTAGVLD